MAELSSMNRKAEVRVVRRCTVSCCAVLHMCHAVLRCAVSRFAMTMTGMTAGRPPWLDACGEGELPVNAAECAALEQPLEAGMCNMQQPQHGQQDCCGRS